MELSGMIETNATFKLSHIFSGFLISSFNFLFDIQNSLLHVFKKDNEKVKFKERTIVL